MLIGTLISAGYAAFSSYAETKPELKKIKDKIKDETKHHFDKQKEICKDILSGFLEKRRAFIYVSRLLFVLISYRIT